MAEKNAGVLNVTPIAMHTVPAINPVLVDQAAAVASPTKISTSAAEPSGSEGSRSGSRASVIRPTTTVTP
jgi:hypothetical protein